MKNKYTKDKKSNLTRITRSDERLRRLTGPADELDAICREKLPDGVIRSGSLVGREAEIRQEALIMCLSGFLDGRPGYRSARARNDHEVMHIELIKCASSAMRICKMRLAKKLSDSNAKFLPLNGYDAEICEIPISLDTCDWPLSARVSVVLRAADDALRERKISGMNADVLTMAVSDGLCASEIADKLGITTNAVYQQLQRVKRELPVFINKQELIP
jgi:hypothetical protein